MSRESGKPGPSVEALFMQLIEVTREEKAAHAQRAEALIEARPDQADSPHSSALTHQRYAELYHSTAEALQELFTQHRRGLHRADSPLHKDQTDQQVDEALLREDDSVRRLWRQELENN